MSDLELHIQRVRLGARCVVRDVQLTCAPGSHTAILGPNGAGKTSLLRAIAGLLPFEGVARLGHQELQGLTALQRARWVSYVPQRSLLDSALSVLSVVQQGRYAHQTTWGTLSKADGHAVQKALEMTDTLQLQQRSYTQLSGGEQRRVLLARALATEAPVLALDEPTASLDLAHSLHFFEQLRSLCAAGRTVLTILHDVRDAERFCDRALVLSGSEVQYTGSAVLPADVVRRVYGVEPVAHGTSRFDLLRGGL